MLETLRLTEQLIARASITPDDAGCQALLGKRLEASGFELETIVDGPEEAPVSNLWAVRRGSAAGDAARTMVFAGHTDVVPTGARCEVDERAFRANTSGRQALRAWRV